MTKKSNIKTAASSDSGAAIEKESYVQLPLVKINFILMACAAAMIVLGFLLMTGGGSSVDEFNPEVFSTRRIVVAPTISFLGFVFMGVAIMWNGRRKNSTEDKQQA